MHASGEVYNIIITGMYIGWPNNNLAYNRLYTCNNE